VRKFKHIIKQNIRLFVGISIGLLVGIIVSYTYFNQKFISQSLKQNANIEGLSKQIVACQHDPSSNECNPQWNLNNTGYIPGLSSKDQIGINCQDTATDAASIYWRYKNCPSPTPLIKYVNVTVPATPHQTICQTINRGLPYAEEMVCQ
jgi:uncharacterized protein YneF (UPF0154 family)